jgi:hypothetical protein
MRSSASGVRRHRRARTVHGGLMYAGNDARGRAIGAAARKEIHAPSIDPHALRRRRPS